MSKKHYEAIAAMFARNYAAATSDDERRGIVGSAMDLSSIMAADNPRFDRPRFLKACCLTRECLWRARIGRNGRFVTVDGPGEYTAYDGTTVMAQPWGGDSA